MKRSMIGTFGTAWLLLIGCAVAGVGLSVTPVLEPVWDPPVPLAYEGDEEPTLVETRTPGLLAARDVDETLFYYEPWERWFRYAFGQWYEAFAWNGNWFPPERVPFALRALHSHDPATPPVNLTR